jgi:hypothetical protein
MRPTIRARIVSTARVKIADGISSPPDYHFSSGPHCRMLVAWRGHVTCASSSPTVGCRIVSSARIQKTSTSDNHFGTGPYVVCESRAEGALVVLVAVQVSVVGLYLPPVFKFAPAPLRPQMTISLPVHTAVWYARASGALLVLMAIQASGVHQLAHPIR